MKEEIYKDIIKYKGLYQVSNLGNIKSLSKGDGNGNRIRVLKQEVNKKSSTSYRRVSLSTNGKVERFLVHRLVASAFIPNPNNKPYINHIDNNGENNTVENLEWCTHSENMIHAQTQGRLFKSQSKGGQISGEISKETTLKKHLTLIGKVVNDLKVDKVIERSDTVRPYYAVCTCTNCGLVSSKEINALQTSNRKNHTHCTACIKTERTKLTRQRKLNKLIGRVINGSEVISSSFNEKNENYYVETKCKLCCIIKTVTLDHFMDKRYNSKCCNN